VTRQVLLVGGFGLPPQLLSRLARDVGGRIAPTGLTIDCGEVEVAKVLRAIDTMDDAVTLIGHSRGGQLARVAAVRRPNVVRRLVTVGTPSSLGPPDRWGVRFVAAAFRRLPARLALDCATADCCAEFRADLRRAVEVTWVAVWSPHDRIVAAHEARHDGAQLVEVRASHLGLVTSPAARSAIANTLA
jgi:pimeloyl-ACP methyl ester carboxylesterase